MDHEVDSGEIGYAASPGDVQIRFDLAKDLGNLGIALQRKGLFDQALPHFQRARPINEALVKASPGEPRYVNILADNLVNLGYVLSAVDPSKAEEPYQTAISLYDELVKAHPEMVKNVSAVLVHDMGTNYLSGIGATKAQKSDIETAFAAVIGLDSSMPFAIREVPGLRGGGSDHASFLSGGAPGFFWGQSGKAVYNHTHHTQFDTYDAAIPEYQRHSQKQILDPPTGHPHR